jgi:hypothetical protein
MSKTNYAWLKPQKEIRDKLPCEMVRPPKIGSINCYSASLATFGKKQFVFDGTTLGLVKSALKEGAKAGSRIKADYGAGLQPHTVVAAPHDQRAGGFWVQ